LDDQNMKIQEVTSHGLTPFRPESASESPEWYVNLFASRS
jgi:hypothetical protein